MEPTIPDSGTILWFNGSHLNSYTPDTTETVWARITSKENCSASDTIKVTEYPMPKVNLGKDASVCGDDKMTLDASNPGATYYWTINDTFYSSSQTITIGRGVKTIEVEVSYNNLCKTSDTINILLCKYEGIPNAFTPGRLSNRTWIINGLSDNYPKVVVQVYDRWGRLVYRSSPGYPGRGWDGTNSSGPLPMDTYFYVIDFYGNGRSTQNGNVTIIR